MRKKSALYRPRSVPSASAPASAPVKRALSLSSPMREALAWTQTVTPTLDDVRKRFAPPLTLGAPEQARMAMDAAFDAAGGYTLLQHSLDLGMFGSMSSFMGYGALQNIAQNGLIRACVETVADDMTRAWIDLSREGADAVATEENSDTDRLSHLSHPSPFPAAPGVPSTADADGKSLLAELTAEMKRLDLQRIIHDAATMTGYYGGCLLYLDTGAVGPELAEPLNLDARFSREAGRRGFLRAVRVIDPINVFPGPYNSTDPLAADYYVPRQWWILGKLVHASRLIRVVQNEAPLMFRPAYNFLGIPQAQILWDYVIHFQDNRDAENRLLNKFSTFVFKTAMSDIITGAANDLASLDARMQILARNRSNDGVLAIDKDAEDVVKVETPLSGVSDIVRQSLEILAALNRTPAVKLLGISPSGFNATGESDIRNYYDHIRSQQEKVLRSPIKTILDVMQISLWGEIDENITFDFCPLSEADANSIAVTQQTKINSIVQLIQNNVISAEEARRVLIADPDSGFNDLDPAEVPDPEGGELESFGGYFPTSKEAAGSAEGAETEELEETPVPGISQAHAGAESQKSDSDGAE